MDQKQDCFQETFDLDVVLTWAPKWGRKDLPEASPKSLQRTPDPFPMSNLYIQWDLTWGVQGLWRRIAAKGPHSVQERKSSESWLETRKDEKEWKKLGKKAHNCINTCLTTSLLRLLPAVPMRPSKTSHLGWCEVSIVGWKSLSKLLKESMKSKIQKDHESTSCSDLTCSGLISCIKCFRGQ